MKTLIILGDGMADEPIAELGGKTPLQYADTPAMDMLPGNIALAILAALVAKRIIPILNRQNQSTVPQPKTV